MKGANAKTMPAERSISPQISSMTSPAEMIAVAAANWETVRMLFCVKKFWLETWKYTTRMIATTMILASPQEDTSQVRPESSPASRLFRLCLLSGAWKNVFGHSIYSFMMLRCFFAMARHCLRYKQLDNKSVEALLAGTPTVHRLEQIRLFSFGIEPITVLRRHHFLLAG